ncbi:MAG TPA: hypothetical protein VGM03_03040, partial [Phycisphaerae bacterium]
MIGTLLENRRKVEARAGEAREGEAPAESGSAGASPSRESRDAAPPTFELAAIVDAYTDATEKLKRSHEKLTAEVQRLSQQLDEKNRELARSER